MKYHYIFMFYMFGLYGHFGRTWFHSAAYASMSKGQRGRPDYEFCLYVRVRLGDLIMSSAYMSGSDWGTWIWVRPILYSIATSVSDAALFVLMLATERNKNLDK